MVSWCSLVILLVDVEDIFSTLKRQSGHQKDSGLALYLESYQVDHGGLGRTCHNMEMFMSAGNLGMGLSLR